MTNNSSSFLPTVNLSTSGNCTSIARSICCFSLFLPPPCQNIIILILRLVNYNIKMEVESHSQELLTLFHFNDVYNVQPMGKQPKGGAAYFNSLLQRQKKKYNQVLTLFSGDAFSPSLLSTQFEGENMIKPLVAIGIDLACYGNHDLDYGLEQLQNLTKQSGFPWLLSNVYNRHTNRRLAQGLQYYIFNKNGVRIGVFSLAEKQWIDTLYPYFKQICEYIDFIDFANVIVKKLREQLGCQMVIALTHMMKYNDIKLAKSVQGIDLILGGHDHLIVHQKINNTVLVKSGSDFKSFSILKVHRKTEKYNSDPQAVHLESTNWIFDVELKEVNHEIEKIIPDPQLDHYIEQIYQSFKEKSQKIACYTLKDLDLLFGTIRKEQSPYLQFLVSIYRHETGADLAMMNAGNFRMDTYIKAGPVTFGVIENVISDTIVVVLAKGSVLIQALQNAVSMYPNLAGRYSAFSGIQFTWDCSQKPGQRILIQTIRIHNKPIDLNHIYKVAVHSFAAQGGDGYQCFKQCSRINDDNDKLNMQLIHDLLHINHYLLDSYIPKYPGRFNIIQKDGNRYLELNLPEPKNVHMIMTTGHPYDKH